MKDDDDNAERNEQFGYEAAPELCTMLGGNVELLLQTVEDQINNPDTSIGYVQRSKGAARWCREQIK